MKTNKHTAENEQATAQKKMDRQRVKIERAEREKLADQLKKLHPPRARARREDSQLVTVKAEIVQTTDITQALEKRIGIEKFIDVLLRCMDAKISVYDRKAKRMIIVEDGRTQMDAVSLGLAYLVGRPIERRIIEQHTVDSMADVEQKLAQSPALREQLTKMIEAAKAKAGQQAV